MATAYYTPGVYMEEVDRGPKPIQGVSTAVAAFIGFTEQADTPGEAHLVTNWNQYTQKFGGFVPGAYLPFAVSGYFDNGGERCYVISVGSPPATAAKKSISGLEIKALKGGPRGNKLQVIIEPGDETAEAEPPTAPEAATPTEPSEVTSGAEATTPAEPPPPPKRGGAGRPASKEPKGSVFTLVIKQDEVELERFKNVTLSSGKDNIKTRVAEKKSEWIAVEIENEAALVEPGRYQLEGGRFEALLPIKLPELRGDPAKRRGLGGLEALDDVTMVACPDLMSAYLRGNIDEVGVQAIQQAMLDHCARMKYRFAILDAPPKAPAKPIASTESLQPHMMNAQEVEEWRYKKVKYDSKYGALYYPWIQISDPLSDTGAKLQIPPCGHMAGIYARTDSERGVHKAPANEIVRGALDLEINVTKGEQDGLNPKGINCIRSFPGRGVRVWGARTLSDDPAWRYINVRRLFNYVEASIENSTQWVVFEPNDSTLWAKVRRDVSSFLRTVWLSGALFGNTPEEAFYVRCDESLNPPEIRDLGQMIVEIGLAPVKPAEFVIFRISQWAGPNAQA
jgi:hypothetical protein